MIWIEVRYRRLMGDFPGVWETLPRVPDGVPRFRTPPLVVGAEYEAWFRRVNDLTGETGRWIPLGKAPIGFTNPPPAPVEELRVVCGEALVWNPPLSTDGPSGLRFRVLHAPGNWPHPGDMVAAVDDWPAAPPFELCLIPRGRRTLCVIPIDPEGQEGEPRFLLSDRGPFDDAEPVEGRETEVVPVPDPIPSALVIEGAAVTPERLIRQDVNPAGALGRQPFYIGGKKAPFYRGEPSDDFYVTSYREATIVQRYVAGTLNGDYQLPRDHGVVTLDLDITAGINWRVEYRRNAGPFYIGTGESPFYRGTGESKFRQGLDGSSAFYGAGGDPFYDEVGSDPFYKVASWRPWPGKLRDLPRTRMDFRVVIPASSIRATVSRMAIRETVPIPVGHGAADPVSGDLSGPGDSPAVVGVHFGDQALPLGTTRPQDGAVVAVKDGALEAVTTVPTWRTIAITYQDFAVGAMSSQKQIAYAGQRVVIHETIVEVVEEWLGGFATSVELDLGDVLDAEGILADFEMKVAAGTFTREGTGKLHSVAAGTKILARADSDVNLGLLTQGRSVVRFLMSSME